MRPMHILLVTASAEEPSALCPALGLLPHDVHCYVHDHSAVRSVAAAVVDHICSTESYDALLLDARTFPTPSPTSGFSQTLCRTLRRELPEDCALVVVLSPEGVRGVSAEWQCDDFFLTTISPTEADVRLRCCVDKRTHPAVEEDGLIRLGDLVIDETTYVAKLKGRTLDLAYKEFELLKYLAHHAGRVYSRSHLVHEVWGYDFFGGTRTVDVHVRRLRAKLGPEYEGLICTVRNVGYKAVVPHSSSTS